MRPAGARERIEGAARSENAILDSWADRQLRIDLRAFVDACGLLGFHDFSARVPIRGFAAVDSWLDDPTQVRTGSDFEARCLSVVEALRPAVAPLAARVEDLVAPELDVVEPALREVPPRLVLGDEGSDRERFFDLVCWNQANALAEGVQRPYFAAVRICAAGYHQPADPFGLVEPMKELRVAYEDEPEHREETSRRIVDLLERYRVAAPFPYDGTAM